MRLLLGGGVRGLGVGWDEGFGGGGRWVGIERGERRIGLVRWNGRW